MGDWGKLEWAIVVSMTLLVVGSVVAIYVSLNG